MSTGNYSRLLCLGRTHGTGTQSWQVRIGPWCQRVCASMYMCQEDPGAGRRQLPAHESPDWE